MILIIPSGTFFSYEKNRTPVNIRWKIRTSGESFKHAVEDSDVSEEQRHHRLIKLAQARPAYEADGKITGLRTGADKPPVHGSERPIHGSERKNNRLMGRTETQLTHV
jgi:hypothetical protein